MHQRVVCQLFQVVQCSVVAGGEVYSETAHTVSHTVCGGGKIMRELESILAPNEAG